jgi:hypothetical protein
MRCKVKGWKDHQHYKDRTPPWIKLHRGLLDDFQFHRLPLASKALAPMVWLLASEDDNGFVDVSHEYLGFRLRMSPEEVDEAVKPLIDKGWLIPDSEALASCKQEARLETEEETEEEGDILSSSSDDRPKPCPYQKIIEVYREALPECHDVQKIDGYKKAMQSIWREDEAHQNLEFWQWYFSQIRETFMFKPKNIQDRGYPTLTTILRRKTFNCIINGEWKA